MSKCSCTDGILNSGYPSCSEGFGRTVKLLFVPYYDSTGAINYVDSNTAIGGLVYSDDLSLRMYPTDKVLNIVDERGDAIVETLEGVDYEIEGGKRVFTGEFANKYSGTPAYLTFLNSLKCPIVGVYYITEDNKLVGRGDRSTQKLYPFLIQQGSFKTKYVAKTYNAVSKVNISFTLDSSMADEDIQFIEGAVDLLGLKGLTTVYMQSTTPATTTQLTIDSAYITTTNSVNRIAFTDSLNAWYVFNNTTVSNITPSSIVNTTGTTFVITIPAQTSGDVIEVKAVTSTGYESNKLLITIP